MKENLAINSFATELYAFFILFSSLYTQGNFSNFQQDVSIIQSINMNNVKNAKERKTLLMTESKRFAFTKGYLLTR